MLLKTCPTEFSLHSIVMDTIIASYFFYIKAMDFLCKIKKKLFKISTGLFQFTYSDIQRPKTSFSFRSSPSRWTCIQNLCLDIPLPWASTQPRFSHQVHTDSCKYKEINMLGLSMVNSCVCHTQQQQNSTFHTFTVITLNSSTIWLKDNQDDFDAEKPQKERNSTGCTHNTYTYAQRPNLRCSP